MRPAPSAAEASRGLSSVKTGEPPADDDIVTSVAYEPNDDAEPVSPELALVDPSLAERLRANMSEAAPEPEPAAAAPPEPVAEAAPIPDPVPVEAVPEPPPAVVPVDVDPVATADPRPTDDDRVDGPAADEPELPSASVHLRPSPALVVEPAAVEPAVVVEPSVVPVPAVVPVPDPEPETVREPEPVIQVPAVPPAAARGRSSVSPLRRRSRFWHVLVLLATVVLFAGVVAVGVVVVSELTDSGSGVTASGDPPAAAEPQPGDEQEPGAAPAPTESAGALEPRRFAWAPVDGAVSYRFELFRGDEQVLRTTTTSPVYELPTSWEHEGREERLTSGSYRWYVWPVLASGPRTRRSSRHVSTSPSRRRTPGRALRRRTGSPGWCRRRLLGSGGAAAPGREFLALLPSGPDAVRTLPVRGTRPSTPRVDDPCP